MKYNVDDRLPFGAMALYGMQWFILAIAVVTTSVFVATGTPAEKLFFAQKLFAVMGITGFVQVLFGHRLPIVAGPAAVLLVGVLSAIGSGASSNAIYSSTLRAATILCPQRDCYPYAHSPNACPRHPRPNISRKCKQRGAYLWSHLYVCSTASDGLDERPSAWRSKELDNTYCTGAWQRSLWSMLRI